jgi:hypothetical protein
MQYEHIDAMSAEIDVIITPIRATLEQAREDSAQARASMVTLKALGELERFLKGLQEEIVRAPEPDKLRVAALGIAKATDFLAGEQLRVRERTVSTSERVAVLESVVGHLTSHQNSLLTKKEAVDRVVEGDTDPRHPEKISVVREAERVKKAKKAE